MESRRLQCDNLIPLLHVPTVYNIRSIYDSYGKSCKIILVSRIGSRHLRRFSSHKTCSRHFTSRSYSAHNFSHLFRRNFTCPYIVQKEQRFCAFADYVVYTHRNTVDTDGIVLIQLKCQSELSAHTVCA